MIEIPIQVLYLLLSLTILFGMIPGCLLGRMFLRDKLEVSLFKAIAHGDHKHRAWLYSAIIDHLRGRPVRKERK